ncbi:unnamed protein product [Rhizoctonia solani]|uniref:Fungal-specific transcription factor domain protein n=1 Tax=Rhizoctonia solani TaxID=456999 RepID=A0A8H3GFB7_9AGAM|nr:unnamed protein product [Rhizoctonia solani]
MSLASTKSMTDFCACNTEREERDETEPLYSRCQQSRIECPVYTSIEHPNTTKEDILTLSAPHTATGRPRATAHEETPVSNTEELNYNLVTADSQDQEDSEGVVSVIHRELVLDKTAESNALPFVLQSYSAWISRLALDPRKLTHITRDLVFSQFEGGDESRWIIVLVANIGSRVGSVELVESRPTHMLSMLQSAVRRQLAAVKSQLNPKKSMLVKALESATEAMMVHFYVGPVSEVMVLRHEVAPIFRQLCPEPLNAPIDLPSLLQHPLSCLRYYAHIDILIGAVGDRPTLFRYGVPIPSSQLSNPYRPVPVFENDGVIQWMRGTPNEMIILFAKMKTMREDGLTPTTEMVASIEREIHELLPFDGSSSERFLAIMRSIVHECWRQAAYIYLYMAVCRDSSDTPRVKEAFKRYMRLLNGTQPGRLPDEFLIWTLQLVSPAAQRNHDRDVLARRAMGLYTRDRTYIANIWIALVIKDVWTRAAAEGRPVMWCDIAVSRKQLLGV